MDNARDRVRRLAGDYVQRDDPTGWFEPLYAEAAGDASLIPWADLVPNPAFTEWADRIGFKGSGGSALVVGCGLGDDAEELRRRGWRVTAFDISPTAIAWCRRRFPDSGVQYVESDLLKPPREWRGAFDFALETYTLQALPTGLRTRAIEEVASFIRPGGSLLVISRGRRPEEPDAGPPWPLLREEFDRFLESGLKEDGFEEFMDSESPPVRRFRACYRRKYEDSSPASLKR
ncbi:MAG TPA: class I SAM-dependent methyltransferase [Planctomycetota bacterium]|nr:class I SAM-dependent methyltransferase [Planctomycetota bacterium]